MKEELNKLYEQLNKADELSKKLDYKLRGIQQSNAPLNQKIDSALSFTILKAALLNTRLAIATNIEILRG